MLVGWNSYHFVMQWWKPGLWTQRVTFFERQPVTFGETLKLIAVGHLVHDGDGPRFWAGGRIGTERTQETAGVSFYNSAKHAAGFDVSPRGASLALSDSTRAIYLGTGLYDDRQLLLELITRDNQQGIRLGLDARQQPVFQVIRDGVATSLLDPPPASGVSAGKRSGP